MSLITGFWVLHSQFMICQAIDGGILLSELQLTLVWVYLISVSAVSPHVPVKSASLFFISHPLHWRHMALEIIIYPQDGHCLVEKNKKIVESFLMEY